MEVVPSVPEMFQDISQNNVDISTCLEGNTSTSHTIEGNKSKINPAKNWCFTLHNYTECQCSRISDILSEYCDKFIVGKELGKSGEKPHLQGYFSFKEKRRPVNLFGIKEIHFEKAKGSPKQNYEYCTKEGNVWIYKGFDEPPEPLKIIQDKDLYHWQREAKEMLLKPPNDRDIYWFYGDFNIGKTQFVKHMCHLHKAIPLEGEKRHMLSVVASNTKCKIFMVVLGKGDKKVSYRAIEKIKDGCFMSHFGTDNTRPVIMNSPHICVFGNERPDISDGCYHKDKYKVYKINNDYTSEYQDYDKLCELEGN